MSRHDIVFTSEAAELHGWLYEPEIEVDGATQPSSQSSPSWPLVVMANGFSATRRMSTDAYAEAFGTGVLTAPVDRRCN